MPTLEPTTSQPTSFVLSFQGVDFRLEPQQFGASIAFDHAKTDQIVLQLTNFTGALQVTPTAIMNVALTASPAPPNAVTPTITATPPTPPTNVSPTVGRVSLSPEQKPIKKKITTPIKKKTTKTTQKRKTTKKVTKKDTDEEDNKKRCVPTDDDSSTSTKKSRVEYEETPTGYMQEDDDSHDDSVSNNSVSDDSLVEEDVDTARTTSQHYVSPDTKALSFNNNAPPPRWGHTMTSIEDGSKALIYGGQTLTEDGVTTHGDLYVYDFAKAEFSKPVHCEGVERQWHSATYLAERQLLIAFGGEAPDSKGKIATLNQVMVLDTEIMLWYPPSVTGDIPAGRSGHTATMIMDHQMVVFGGVKSNKYQRTVSVLDTNRWKWTSPPKIMGDAPRPRSYHSATTVKKGDQKDWIVVVGGNDHDTCFNTVHVLEVNDGRWSWINPIMSGDLPSPRTGHAATLMEDGKTIFIQGGWDPNAEDEEEIIYEDCFLLDTSTWTWTKSEKTVERALVGHKAVQCKNEVHMFGGRLAGGKFSNDLLTLSLD